MGKKEIKLKKKKTLPSPTLTSLAGAIPVHQPANMTVTIYLHLCPAVHITCNENHAKCGLTRKEKITDIMVAKVTRKESTSQNSGAM